MYVIMKLIYDTFMPYNKKKSINLPKKFPLKVDFYNTLDNNDYFQIYIKCKLRDFDKVIFPPNKSFYIKSNDNKYFLFSTDDKGLDSTELAICVLIYLIKWNIYANIKHQEKKSKMIDIHKFERNYPLYDYASNLSVHSIEKIKELYNDLPVYIVNLSS